MATIKTDTIKGLQNGINKLAQGDTLEVAPGTYSEQINIVVPNVTIVAHYGALLDGRAGVESVNSGLPKTGIKKTAKGTGRGYTDGNLVNIKADNVTWDGISVIRSLGSGIAVWKKDNGRVLGVKIRNCTLSDNRFRALELLFPSDITLYKVIMRRNVAWLKDSIDSVHGANMNGKGVNGLMMEDCIVAGSHGEGVMIDANHYESKTLMFYGCHFYDNLWGNLNIAGSSGISIDACTFYVSDEYWDPSKSNEWVPKNLTIRGREPELGRNTDWHGVRDLLCTNSLFVHGNVSFVMGGGNKLMPDGSKQLDPQRRLENIKFLNNTFVNNTNALIADNNLMQSGVQFKNNIVLQSNGKFTTNDKRADWEVDGNVWWPQIPDWAGSNDINENPQLENPGVSVSHGGLDPENYSPNYSPKGTSPALGFANIGDAPLFDYFGDERPPEPAAGAMELIDGTVDPPTPDPEPEPEPEEKTQVNVVFSGRAGEVHWTTSFSVNVDDPDVFEDELQSTIQTEWGIDSESNVEVDW